MFFPLRTDFFVRRNYSGEKNFHISDGTEKDGSSKLGKKKAQIWKLSELDEMENEEDPHYEMIIEGKQATTEQQGSWLKSVS